jgi:hypothetical protein
VTPAGAVTWTDPDWRRAHLAWVEGGLDRAGLTATGPISQVNVRPWSTQFAVETTDGRVWSKAAGPGVAHEAAILERFATWGIQDIVPLLAVDVPRAWLLLPDGGPRLRELAPDLTGDRDLDAWDVLLPRYASLQRTLVDHADDLLAAGVPDERPSRYPAMLAALLGDDRIWSRVDRADRQASDLARRSLAETAPAIEAMASALDSSGIASTLDHGDLHAGNIFAAPARYRFFDWGDSAIAHPFVSMTTTLNSIAEKTGLDPDGPELTRVCDAYLEAWTDLLPRTALTDVLRLAIDLGHIGKAAAWERALLGLDPEAMEDHHGGTAAWLVDLDARLRRRDKSPIR